MSQNKITGLRLTPEGKAALECVADENGWSWSNYASCLFVAVKDNPQARELIMGDRRINAAVKRMNRDRIARRKKPRTLTEEEMRRKLFAEASIAERDKFFSPTLGPHPRGKVVLKIGKILLDAERSGYGGLIVSDFYSLLPAPKAAVTQALQHWWFLFDREQDGNGKPKRGGVVLLSKTGKEYFEKRYPSTPAG